MKDRNFRVVGDLTNANIIVDCTFWIGVYPGLTRAHLDYIVDRFHKFIGEKTGRQSAMASSR